MIIAPISSGSKGNCILIEEKGTKILVDAGVSKKRIEEGLSFYGCDPYDIDAILITHEHDDHIKGLGVFLRKYDIPTYATDKTKEYLLSGANIGCVDSSLFCSITSGKSFRINNVSVTPVPISHDAADPVCYRFDEGGKSCAIVTDLGTFDDSLIAQLKSLNGILIESNHDLRMLQIGHYPYQLKQRIWGDKGHLSNESCGRLLGELLHENLEHIILGHLSGENNYPELAFEAVRNEINFSANSFCAEQFDIKVASRTKPSCLVEF